MKNRKIINEIILFNIEKCLMRQFYNKCQKRQLYIMLRINNQNYQYKIKYFTAHLTLVDVHKS